MAALLIRVAAILATPHLPLASDAQDYSRHARSIAAGRGYPPSSVISHPGPTAIRPPGFPLVLGAVYKLTADSLTAGRVAEAVIGAICVLLTALLVRELWGGPAALIAGAIAAVFPPLIIDGMTLMSEPLFVAFELAAVLAVLRWRRTGGVSWLVASGALAGAALLTRSSGGLLLLVLAAAARREGSRGLARAYRPAVTLVATAVLVVAPWTIRNAVELHSFIPVSDQDGYTLAGTYNAWSRAHDAVWIVATIDPAMRRLVRVSRRLDEPALDAKLRGAARQFALDHPDYLGSVALHNSARLFNLGGADYERAVAAGDYGLGPGWAPLMTWGLIPFLILAAAGALTGAARAAPRWLWAVPIAMLGQVMVLATNRTRAPIDPFLIMLSALAVVALGRRLGRMPRRRA